MPPHTRSQRRRQTTRQQTRSTASAETTTSRVPNTGATIPLESPAVPSSVPANTAARPARTNRRVLSRTAPEPVDYSKDYAAVSIDLRRIALWSILLFVAMVALKFSGLVG